MSDSVVSIGVDIGQAEQSLNKLKQQYKSTQDAFVVATERAIKASQDFDTIQKRAAAKRNKLAGMGEDDPSYAKEESRLKKLIALQKRLAARKVSSARTVTALKAQNSLYDQTIKFQEKRIKETKLENKAVEQLSTTEEQNNNAMKDRLLVYSKAEQASRKYKELIDQATAAHKKGIISSKEYAAAKRNLAKAEKAEIASLSRSTQARGSAINTLVRHLRQVETFIFAMYTMKKAYDTTLGAGHEFNKIIENETAGLKVLAVQSLADNDAMGKKLTLLEKYKIAGGEASKIFELAKKINPETPYNLGDTIKAYKSIFPQLIKYKASLEDIAEVTKRMTILGKARNLDIQQFKKTVDTAFTGQMKPSEMELGLKSVGITNQLVKKWQEQGTLVKNVLERLKSVDAEMSGITASFDTAVSNFVTQWDILWADIQKPLFDKFKSGIAEASKFVKNNNAEIKEAVLLIPSLVKWMAVLAAAWAAQSLKTKIFGSSLKALALDMKAIQLNAAVMGTSVSKFGVLASMAGKKMKALALGMKAMFMSNLPMIAITAAFYAYEKLIGEAEEKQDQFTDAINRTSDAIKDMGVSSRADMRNTLVSGLIEGSEKLKELRRDLTDMRREQGTLWGKLSRITQDDITHQESLIEIQRESNRKTREKIALVDSVTKEIGKSEGALYKTVNAADKLAQNLKIAKGEAYGLANALDDAVRAMEKQEIRMKVLTGKISKMQGLKLGYNIDKSGIEKEAMQLGEKFSALGEIGASKGFDSTEYLELQTKLQREAVELRTKEMKINEGLIVGEKAITDEIARANNHKVAGAASSKRQNVSAQKAAILADKAANSTIKYTNEVKKQEAIKEKIALLEKGGAAKTWLAKVNAAKIEYNAAKGAAKLAVGAINGEKSRAKAAQAVTAEYEAQLKLMELLAVQADQISNVGTNLFDNLASGDVRGALGSLLDDVMDVFLKPVKDKFSELFDQSFGKMIGKATDAIANSITSLTGSMGTALSGFSGAIAGAGLAAIVGIFRSMGSTISAAQMKQAQGITTVLSPTIENAITTIEKNSTLGLDYSADMVDSLHKIVSLSDSAAANIGSNLTGDNYIARTDKGFWNDRSTELVSSGINLSPATIQQLNEGQLTGVQYMIEKVTDSGFLGIGSGESLKTTNMGPAGNDVLGPISEGYLESVDVLQQATEALGMSVAEFDTAAATWETSISQLNFQGKTQAEIADMINGVIGADMDRWGETLGQVAIYADQFKRAGEGTAETIIRMANDWELVDRSMRDVGIILPNVAHGGLAVAEGLTRAAGGMDVFMQGMSAFISGFYTSEEQTRMLGNHLNLTLQGMNLTLPTTSAGFRQMGETLLTTAAQSQITATNLWNLANAATVAGNASAAAAYTMQATAAQMVADANALQAADFIKLSSDARKYYDGLEGISQEMAAIPAAAPAISSIPDALGSAAGCANNINNSMQSAADAARQLSEDSVALANDILSELTGTITNYMDAIISLDEELGNGIHSIAEAQKMVKYASLDNYNEILSALQAGRDYEIDSLEKAVNIRLDALKEEEKIISGITSSLKKIADAAEKMRGAALDKTVYAEGEYRKMYSLINMSLMNGRDISEYVSDFLEYASDFSKAIEYNATSSKEATLEKLKLAHEMDQLNGSYTGTTLDDIRSQIDAVDLALETQTKAINDGYESVVKTLKDMIEWQYRSYLYTSKELYAKYLGRGSSVVTELGMLYISSGNVEQIGEYQSGLLETANQKSYDIETRLIELSNYTQLNNILNERIRAANDRISQRVNAYGRLAHGDSVSSLAIFRDSFNYNVQAINSQTAALSGAIGSAGAAIANAVGGLGSQISALQNDIKIAEAENAAKTAALVAKSDAAIADAKTAADSRWDQILDKTIALQNGTPSPLDYRMPHLASGGIVTSPTVAMIGEGRYSEAVIPLKNPDDPMGTGDLLAELKRANDRLEMVEAHMEEVNKASKKQLYQNTKATYLLEDIAG